MQEKQYLYKIYSRKRLNIFKTPKYNRNKNTKKIYIVIIILITSTTYYIMNRAINPIFEKICSDEAKSIATKITNEQSTNIMLQHTYDEMFTIQKDQNRQYTNDKCKYFSYR